MSTVPTAAIARRAQVTNASMPVLHPTLVAPTATAFLKPTVPFAAARPVSLEVHSKAALLCSSARQNPSVRPDRLAWQDRVFLAANRPAIVFHLNNVSKANADPPVQTIRIVRPVSRVSTASVFPKPVADQIKIADQD